MVSQDHIDLTLVLKCVVGPCKHAGDVLNSGPTAARADIGDIEAKIK